MARGSGLLVTRRLRMYGPHLLTLAEFPASLCPQQLQQEETHIFNLQELAGQSTISFRYIMKQTMKITQDPRTSPRGCTTSESKVRISCTVDLEIFRCQNVFVVCNTGKTIFCNEYKSLHLILRVTHTHTHTTQFPLKPQHNITPSDSQWGRHLPFVVRQLASQDPQLEFLKTEVTFNSGTTRKKMTQ